jgi:hypothetical protein
MRSTWMTVELFPEIKRDDSATQWRSPHTLTSALIPQARKVHRFVTVATRSVSTLRPCNARNLVVMADIWIVVGIIGFVTAMVSVIFGVGRADRPQSLVD